MQYKVFSKEQLYVISRKTKQEILTKNKCFESNVIESQRQAEAKPQVNSQLSKN